ncbi:hypothetical protein [Streptomyces uncialis]|uniref:Uncharacterized protein n=1 Tax=Streptomyces uncialis TaxID=1048205 RepID=A0A1Q4V070_9ACTN|nr:hypothetical protein [Streptomyces uncialis]OKH91201.1 hypothetical protein AB852_32735 [Streptomyces uncialis]
MTEEQPPGGEWRKLKPDAEHALRSLLEKVDSHASPMELFESYAYTKEVTARAVQARMEMYLPDSDAAFHHVRGVILRELTARYGHAIPESILRVPYGSSVHERIFALLHEQLARPVPAAIIRIVTADNVHTERRIRELRELGLDVHPTGSGNEQGGYELRSLEVDLGKLPSIARNIIRSKKSLPADRRAQMLRDVGISGDE